jgi:hypothetical protein
MLDLGLDYDINSLPELTRDRVKLLWYIDYYDEILSGICSIDGKYHYFSKIADTSSGDRKYLVLEPTPEQIKLEQERHEFFRLHVGNHTDLVKQSDPIVIKSPQQQELFYQQYPPEDNFADYSSCKPVGWFSYLVEIDCQSTVMLH